MAKTKKKVNVALIGYRFMGDAHSNAYLRVAKHFDVPAEPVMSVLCGHKKSGKDLEDTAARWGWQRVERDWRKVVDDPEIDVVDICTPNDTHAEIAVAAAKAGKIVFCEKPLALDVAEAKKMADAVKRSKKPSLVWFCYRFTPALQLARRIVEEKRIGRIYHFRAQYLQDWIADPNFPLLWRMNKKVAGSGAHGDINAHIIDMGRFLVGELDTVSATMETFVKERPLPESGGGLSGKGKKKKGKVTVDDAVLAMARFKNGALGSFEATRFAHGRKNANGFELFGEKGSLAFNFERMNELEFFDATQPKHLQGWTRILATEPEHSYMEGYWPPGHIIGYEHGFVNALVDAMTVIGKGRGKLAPNMDDGLACQKVLAAMEQSAGSGRWVKVK